MNAVGKGSELRARILTASLLGVFVALFVAAAAVDTRLGILLSSAALLAGIFAAWEFVTFCRFQYQNVRAGSLLFAVLCLPQVIAFVFFSLGTFLLGSSSRYLPLISLYSVATLGVSIAAFFWLVELNRALPESRNLADELFVGVNLFAFGAPSLIFVSVYWDLSLWLLLVVAANDIAAYFAGKAWGNTKLAPRTSPGKTVVGSVYGLAAGTACAALLPRLLYLELLFSADQSMVSRTLWSAGLGSFCVLCAQVADLMKSHCKRLHSVKDSGTILPGHGGVLDRIDGLLGGAVALSAGVSLMAVLQTFQG